MRIALRTDASAQIGTGHFARCLALADALKLRRAEVTFISRPLPDTWNQALVHRGYDFRELANLPQEPGDELAHSAWLGTSQAADARGTLAALGRDGCDWLIVDHYALDHRWESVVRDGTRRILAIDDLADRIHDCDVLVDQNDYPDIASRYEGKVPSSSMLLLGPRYALLREEFAQLRAAGRKRDGTIRRVLVFFGGVDAANFTQLAMEALAALGARELHVDVVVGALHPALDEIRRLSNEHGFALHVQTSDMAALTAAADLAIGASGSATWERCCLGVPTVCVPTAANQEPIARGLQARGAAVVLGVHQDITATTLSDEVRALMSDPDRVKRLSAAAAALVDGSGASRVCDLLALSK